VEALPSMTGGLCQRLPRKAELPCFGLGSTLFASRDTHYKILMNHGK
jgi:hypothetical protein